MNEIKYYWTSLDGDYLYEEDPFMKEVESKLFYREIMKSLDIEVFY